ncbi:MAG: F0F1 ATP synthase subunit gamma, partial [Clostridia bacterium]|nr:F0F1 ATP synthase subunit gamma [Clostridia bacterium]
SARMNAMNTANENTKEMLSELKLRYNRQRQEIITREITEIAAASQNQSSREAEK